MVALLHCTPVCDQLCSAPISAEVSFPAGLSIAASHLVLCGFVLGSARCCGAKAASARETVPECYGLEATQGHKAASKIMHTTQNNYKAK